MVFFQVPFLPPVQAWYSGLIPYPILLPIQIGIILLMIRIGSDLSRGAGLFVVPRRAMGNFLRWFSYLYFSAMALRYVFSMALHPERRWLGGTIPIFFHWVLAAYLFVLGRFHTGRQNG